MALLELKNVTKGFGTGNGRREVLSDVNLTVEPGEFVAIVGFSGAGKTTLLSLLAGLTRPDRGEVSFHGAPVLGPCLRRGVVFQNYSLLPWFTVRQNVQLAVEQAAPQLSRAEQRARAQHYVELVNLGPASGKRPAELSGGMRQRVSVARALAMEPEVLLLDEPLSALDALTRGNLQGEFAKLCAASGRTIVLITNDVDEAVLLADRVIPLTAGPQATLGPSFAVQEPRPRDAKQLQKGPGYLPRKQAILRFLLDSAAEKKRLRTAPPPTAKRATEELGAAAPASEESGIQRLEDVA